MQKPSSFLRSKDVTLNRLRLQCCKLNFYLNKIGLKPSPNCESCLVPETVEHFLIHCSKHYNLHNQLYYICHLLKIQNNVSNLLSNSTLFNVIFQYITTNKISI